MEKQKDIDLKELISEASTDLLVERKKGIAGQIKKMLQRFEGLNKEALSLEKQAEKKKKQRQEALDKIDKLRKGDWGVLQELDENGKQKVEDIKEE